MYMTKQQRLVLIVSVLASFVTGLDGFIVNVALPAIARELGGGLVIQQWVVNGYLITLGALMLIAGSLADLFGRKKILQVGLVLFAITSLLCAFAPTGPVLIVARILQGVAGALLGPSSLALIISNFSGSKQSKAIGTWTAWTAIAPAIAPLIGGLLIDTLSWRYIFGINIIPIALALWALTRMDSKEDLRERTKIDVTGAILCTIGLGAIVYALIEQPHYGWLHPLIYGASFVGALSLALFFWYERHSSHPMLPLELFAVRNFSVGNIATTTIYAGLSVSTFLISIFLQQIGGYPATLAGVALLPVTVVMFVLSSRFGALAGKYGPRLFMSAGPIIGGGGFLLMTSVTQNVNYWTQILPGVLLFAIGLSITVAPLTSAILGSIHKNQAGIGSAINNAVARVAGLVAISLLGIILGSNLTLEGFHHGILLAALLLIIGGIVSAFGITNNFERQKD
jgi:EmrB/QacA subfamily drug resistance transporter